jgi:hypothetical protein
MVNVFTVSLTNLCRKNVPSNDVYTEKPIVAVEVLKARMLLAIVFLISDDKTDCVVTIDASKVGIVKVLLQ